MRRVATGATVVSLDLRLQGVARLQGVDAHFHGSVEPSGDVFGGGDLVDLGAEDVDERAASIIFSGSRLDFRDFLGERFAVGPAPGGP